MIHISRKRFIMAGAIAALLTLCWLIDPAGMKSPQAGSSSSHPEGETVTTSEAAVAKVARERPVRASDGKAAEAKLRSLLEVRRGELAFVRLPAEIASGLEDKLQWLLPRNDGEAPCFSMIQDRSGLEKALLAGAAKGMPVEGSMDASDDSFEWKSSKWSLKGTALHGSVDTTFQMELHSGERDLLTMATLVPGGMILFQSGGADPENLLFVVGKDEKAGDDEKSRSEEPE